MAAHILQTILAMWHAAAFGAGGIFVVFAFLSLFGRLPYEAWWGKVIRHADVHLWISGVALILLGAGLKGMVYFDNPKLLAKVTVVFCWLISTQYMRWKALPRFRSGQRGAMLGCCAINVACWLYGAFLGCASSLAYGYVGYGGFMEGFACVLLASVAVTWSLERMFRARAVL